MVRPYWLGIGVLLALLATGAARAGEWSCSAEGAGTRVLTFRGGIDDGENQRFESGFAGCFPRHFAGQRVIDLFSGGGAVDEALAIARTIVRAGTERPIQTRVSQGAVCISACTYLFVAGQFRNVATGGSFEPHGFSSYMGTRIDQVLEVAAKKGGAPHEELQTGRLRTWAPWLVMLAESDARFQFASGWLSLMFEGERLTRAGLARMLEGLNRLTPAQRTFIGQIDAIVAVAMPELERSAALYALEPVFAGGAPRSDGRLPDESRYFRWIVGEFDAAASGYLRTLKDSREPKWGDAFGAAVLTRQREEAADTMKTVAEELWPYLSTRPDIVHQGLLRLMFSTSIIYTRPLTREELCAFNIVNENCYE